MHIFNGKINQKKKNKRKKQKYNIRKPKCSKLHRFFYLNYTFKLISFDQMYIILEMMNSDRGRNEMEIKARK